MPGNGPPPPGVPYVWQITAHNSLDCIGPCLGPNPTYGCTGEYSGQCTWDSAAMAEKYCGQWPECAGFFCSSAEAPNGKTLCFARNTSQLTPPHGSADVAFVRAWNRTVNSTNPIWRMVESGPVRTVFVTDAVSTMHSQVSLQIVLWANLRRLDMTLTLNNWDDAFGVANRFVLPLRTAQGESGVGETLHPYSLLYVLYFRSAQHYAGGAVWCGAGRVG